VLLQYRATEAASCLSSRRISRRRVLYTERIKDTKTLDYTAIPPDAKDTLLAVVGLFSTPNSKPCPSSPVNLHNSSLVCRTVGHSSLTTPSAYTTLSTLFGWLWMRVRMCGLPKCVRLNVHRDHARQ
jgi:hypothetical protein